jgi:hypothetical protein
LDTPARSAIELMSRSAVGKTGAKRIQAVATRLFTPALIDCVDIHGQWRGLGGAFAAMVRRRKNSFGA